MKSNWIKKPLSKVVMFKNGKKRPKDFGNIPVYGGNGILGYADNSNYENCIIIGRVGAYCGSVCYENNKCWVSDNAIAAQPIGENNIIFIYYLLKNLQLNNRHIGTSQPLLTQEILNRIECAIPPVEEQNRIASIINLIDEKIQNNIQINDNLQQQALSIFQEWFIDNPDKTNWHQGTFSELVQSTLNGDWGKESPSGNNIQKVYCIRGADIPDVRAGSKGKMPIRYILPKNYASKMLTDGDIVIEISGGSPTQSTGRCVAVTQSLLERYDSGMVCTNFCKAIKPKPNYSMFIYYYWQYLYDKKVFFAYENGTTGIKNLDFSGFLETEAIVIPPEELVSKFNNYCKSVFDQVFANGKQSEKLAEIRDYLLPRLMSGELDISNIVLF